MRWVGRYGILWVLVSCTSRESGANDTPTTTLSDSTSPDSTVQSETTAIDSDAIGESGGAMPLPVSGRPFVSDAQWPECIHPGVNEDCSNGWCRIPAGCYVFGTPEGTPGRAAIGEEQSPITFTYDMEVMQHELTWAEYSRVSGWPRKIYTNECEEEKCPAKMSWWEAMLFANMLSEKHEPPLPTCYELGDGCVGEAGDRMYCPNYQLTRPGYSCEGYRLPNQFEWQYIARGGTTTDFYTGDLENPATMACIADPVLERIAWYCANSVGPAARPVGLLQPNAWGLYDLFGNVIETLQTLRFPGPGVPTTDPTEPDASGQRLTDAAGGNAVSYPRIMQVARRLDSDFSGVRLVRTLGKGTLPQLGNAN